MKEKCNHPAKDIYPVWLEPYGSDFLKWECGKCGIRVKIKEVEEEVNETN